MLTIGNTNERFQLSVLLQNCGEVFALAMGDHSVSLTVDHKETGSFIGHVVDRADQVHQLWMLCGSATNQGGLRGIGVFHAGAILHSCHVNWSEPIYNCVNTAALIQIASDVALEINFHRSYSLFLQSICHTGKRRKMTP